MKNQNKKGEPGLFTIGEMVALCRTTKDALYFYERKGLVKPYFIDDNGYRYYDLNNFYDLDMILSLREADGSIKEICEFMDQPSPEKYVQYLTQKRDDLAEKRTKLKIIEDRISQTIALTEQGMKQDSLQPQICFEEQQYLIVMSVEDHNNPASFLPVFSELLKTCHKYDVPYDFHLSALISKDRLKQYDYNPDYFYAVSPFQTDSRDSQHKSAGKYLTYLHRGDYHNMSESYEIMMKYIQENHLSIAGNSYEETLIGWLNCSDRKDYKTRISIQIE